MDGYYRERLAADRLRRCYELAPAAVRRYLAAEIEYVRGRIRSDDRVLELGCGYGRVLAGLIDALQPASSPPGSDVPGSGVPGSDPPGSGPPDPGFHLVGIDTSPASLRLAAADPVLGGPGERVALACMDAAVLGFRPGSFDLIVCIQNGISAFGVAPEKLLRSAAGVARSGGRLLFSSYAPEFWPDRLAWFRAQADHGLIGEIDESATGDGVIVCRDGFRARTVTAWEFAELAAGIGRTAECRVVAGSSLFCEIHL